MKKTYISPLIQVVKIATTTFIAVSSANMSTDPSDTITDSDGFGARESEADWE